MNAPERFNSLPDIQAQEDLRNLCIDAVGIKGVSYPVQIHSANQSIHTVATFEMNVGLVARSKGTHMSRFIELLEGSLDTQLDQIGFENLVNAMLAKLEAKSGSIEMHFPYFVCKTAPVSGVKSYLDHKVLWKGHLAEDGRYTFTMRVQVAATSLCPCSKEISAYGAHNQRSHICIEAEINRVMAIEELISIAEQNASCEVYGLLKRPDEKYVTERAFDNPKFVEDLARDVAIALNQDSRIGTYVIEVENFESIHNHSAVASITRPMTK